MIFWFLTTTKKRLLRANNSSHVADDVTIKGKVTSEMGQWLFILAVKQAALFYLRYWCIDRIRVLKCVEKSYFTIVKLTKPWIPEIFMECYCVANCWFSVSRHSGQRNISYTRYLKKCFTQTYRDLYGDAMLLLTWMSSNMADGNQQKHLLPCLATKAWVYTFSNTWTV